MKTIRRTLALLGTTLLLTSLIRCPFVTKASAIRLASNGTPASAIQQR